MNLSAEETTFLQGIPIFGGLVGDTLEAVAQRLEPRDAAADELVVREGDMAQDMFIVRSGSVEVIKDVGGGQVTRLALLQPGACFGEMALIDIQPRSAGVRAVEPSSLLTLSHTALASLWRQQPTAYTIIVMNIAREISRRLRHADRLIASIHRVVTGLDLDV